MTQSQNIETLQRLDAVVSGKVQGVAFRYFTQLKAKELGVVGWCMNQRDGSVLVVAEGEKAQLDGLLAWLYDGSPSSQVRDVKVEWSEGIGKFKQFNVKRF